MINEKQQTKDENPTHAITRRSTQIEPLLEGLDWETLAGIHQSLLLIKKDPTRRSEFVYETYNMQAPAEIKGIFHFTTQQQISRFLNKLTESASTTDKIGHIVKRSSTSFLERIESSLKDKEIPMSPDVINIIIEIVARKFEEEFAKTGDPQPIPGVKTDKILPRVLVTQEERDNSLSNAEAIANKTESKEVKEIRKYDNPYNL